MSDYAYKYDEITELLDGQEISMSPSPVVNHNVVVVNISSLFKTFLRGKTCSVFADGVDVFLTKKDIVIPDVMIVCNRDIIKKDGIYGAPDLIVEILSPSTAKYDKGYKKKLYQKCGVKEYWIVDADARSIDVYINDGNEFELKDVYSVYPDYLLNKMKEEERQAVVMEFKTSLFSELTIQIEDVFEGVM